MDLGTVVIFNGNKMKPDGEKLLWIIEDILSTPPHGETYEIRPVAGGMIYEVDKTDVQVYPLQPSDSFMKITGEIKTIVHFEESKGRIEVVYNGLNSSSKVEVEWLWSKFEKFM